MAAVPDPNYENNEADNERIFKIVNEGVSNILLQIKTQFGRDITTTNQNANAIINLLEGITNTINNIDPTVDGSVITLKTQNLDDGNRIMLTQDPATGVFNANYANNNSDAYYRIAGKTSDGIKIERGNISDLDDKQGDYIYGSRDELLHETGGVDELALTDENNIKIVENRLLNCQNLELLYLVKHEELMKTFAFTLNLFDKYKYAIKILLYVIKNLVYKPSTSGQVQGDLTGKTIKLPKKIITNMKKLLDDQATVKATIEKMNENLNDQVIQNTLNQRLPQAEAQLVSNDLANERTPRPGTTTTGT